MDGTVLIADDDRTIRTVLTQALTRAGCRVHATASLTTLLRWVEEGKGDLVISDVMMPDGNGLETLPKIKVLRPGLPVIIISAQNTIMTAIQATEADAWDYLPKPFDLPDLLARVEKGLTSARRGRRISPPQTGSEGVVQAGQDLPLVGRTPSMQALYRLVAQVMNTALPVLIIGESGTGKSLIAGALHEFSDRSAQPFLVVSAQDLTMDPAGGGDGRALLTQARGGSLVIDGLGDLDGDAQARLVRLLDAAPEDGPRIIAIADETLTRTFESGNFRHDLYFRISGVTLTVPPLRERLDDIPLLTQHFLARTTRETGSGRHMSDAALEVIRRYNWPGNVRQLEHMVQRLMITGHDPEIAATEVEAVLGAASTGAAPTHGNDGGTLAESVARHVRRYFELHGDELPPSGVYQRIMREVEAPLLDIALEYSGGNQLRCAELLGINRNTLRKKTNELDISVTRRRKLM